MKDRATGVTFKDTSSNGLPIFGVGVRKKGPIKIYSLAMYGSEESKEKLAAISRSEEKGKPAFLALQSAAKESDTTFLLQMTFKVGAEKMASAIADSVGSRGKSSSEEVGSLQKLILDGVAGKGGATKSTTLQFDCTKSGIALSVDGESKGEVESSNLSSDFCDVYLDDKCVSPSLRKNCIENCCAE